MQLNSTIAIRATRKLRDQFMKKAAKFGRPADVHRDILQAFVDGRLIIEPDPKKPTLENHNA